MCGVLVATVKGVVFDGISSIATVLVAARCLRDLSWRFPIVEALQNTVTEQGEAPVRRQGPAVPVAGKADGAGPSLEPPNGNTGGGSACRVDWFNVTVPLDLREQARALIVKVLGEPERLARSFYSYREAEGWATGGKACWTVGRRECLFSLNGDSLAWWDAPGLRQLMRELWAMGARCTRLDVAYDDFERSVPLEEVHRAALSGCVVGFKVYQAHRPVNLCTGELMGDSACFGRRGENGSGKYLRIYDKALESKGEMDCIRWEVEFSQERANQAFAVLAGADDQEGWGHAVGALVAGSIDFRVQDAGNGQHVLRRERLNWWAVMLQRLGRCVVKVQRSMPPLDKFMQWVKRCVVPGLALVREVSMRQVSIDEGVFAELWSNLLDEARTMISWRRQMGRELGLDVWAALSYKTA